MTPNELLEEVTSRFIMLLHDNEKALNALLRKSLMKWQEVAGVIKQVHITESGNIVPVPADFLARIGVTDANKVFIGSTIFDDVNGKSITLDLKGYESKPLTLAYMVNLVNVDFDNYQLPDTAIGLLSDYLELLITIPNNQRIRRVAIAGKLDTSDLATESELAQRKADLESQIATNRAIIPIFTISGY